MVASPLGITAPFRRRSPFAFGPVIACATLVATLPATALAQAPQALQFDGTNDYVTFGAAPSLGASTFTIEVRFKRTAAGLGTSSGSGGVTAVPLITKGRGEGDGSVVDMNYFLGIRTSDNVLVADFEEGTGQTSPGLNHPVAGTTPIVNGVWYHGAATFDGTTWRLYLDGNLEATLVVGASRLPQSASTQHAGLATAMTSAGAADGYFAGTLDEARIWNVVRDQGDIQAAMGAEVMSGTGLIARWGLNEGAGANAGNSMAGSVDGTLTNGPVWSTDSTIPLLTETGLRFGGTNAYVTFGDAAPLHLSTFTIETWFRRDGPGITTSTGTGGVDAVPLLAKGTGENENPTVDLNYFLGIRGSDNVLVADFEEGAGGVSPSLNHPVIGSTPIANGTWYHAAATYDGTTWRLYLNGELETELVVGQPCASAGTQHGSLASALTSTGVPEGFFQGALDEARVWSTARTQPEVQSTMNSAIGGPAVGLAARWGLNEDALTVVQSSAGTTVDGTITGSAWSWAAGAPFDITPPTPPADPSGFIATAAGSAQVNLSWTDNSGNETGFEIERSVTGIGGTYAPLATVAANTVTYPDAGLSASSEYCYRVRATNTAGPSGYAGPDCAITTAAPSGTALDFAGSTYVTFGDPAVLDLAQFTVECWFRRDGPGTTTSTGSGGIVNAIPLVTKGTSESDGSNVDENFFLGIDDANDRLIADFEEGAGGSTPGLNHPVSGTTTIANGVWHHAAATYDGTTWQLYLDGNLEATLAVGQPVQSQSIQPAALASSIRSNGTTAQGFFDGALDEARIWSVARTQGQIQGAVNAQITAATPNLVARWGLEEGTGTAVNGSAGTTVNGTVVGANYTWITPGAPFNLSFNLPPAAPTLNEPADQATGIGLAPSLDVDVLDPEGADLTVTYYGRALTGGVPGPDFTLIGQPDTQYYTGQVNGGTNAILLSINNWIVANRASRNIVYVATLGDCVENGDNGGNDIEWQRADQAYDLLENPGTTGLPEGIPYGITVGNHDQSPGGDPSGTTTFYNQYFGEARFLGRDYYGGHYGANNDNWYDLFSAGGMDFIVISFEYDTTPDAPILAWGDQLLTTHADRRAIILSHNLCGTGNPASFSAQGTATYNALRAHPNFFLMMAGHVAGEGRRADTFNGVTVNTLMSDYQSRTNGGNGWIRIMSFSPANNTIEVETYSPWLDQFETDADSRFTLNYNMSSTPAFQLIGSNAVVTSGSNSQMTWNGLLENTTYEWYATVSDGQVTTTGPVWRFTTTPDGTPPTVAVTAPNGGQTHLVGSNTDLTWNAGDNIGVTAVDIALSRTGAAGTYEAIATGIANSGSLAWTVTGPPTTDAYLKVVAHDAVGNQAADLSDAAFTINSVTGVGDELPREFALEPVAPNPAAREARLAYALPRSAAVQLTVHDVQGREVARLVDGVLPAGRHAITWGGGTGGSLTRAGLYFVRLRTPERDLIRRLILIR